MDTVIDGRDAVIVEWQKSFIGTETRCIQMFVIVDKFVWKVTCSVDPEEYDDVKDDLYSIIQSLDIL